MHSDGDRIRTPVRQDDRRVRGFPHEVHHMRITALAGGVGGARFIRGLVHELRETRGDEETEVVVIGNTGDDISLFGLRICPDLDTILYTLGGVVNESQGW